MEKSNFYLKITPAANNDLEKITVTFQRNYV